MNTSCEDMVAYGRSLIDIWGHLPIDELAEQLEAHFESMYPEVNTLDVIDELLDEVFDEVLYG